MKRFVFLEQHKSNRHLSVHCKKLRVGMRCEFNCYRFMKYKNENFKFQIQNSKLNIIIINQISLSDHKFIKLGLQVIIEQSETGPNETISSPENFEAFEGL